MRCIYFYRHILQEMRVWFLVQEAPLEKGMDTPVCLPGESHGQKSLESYGPRGHKESDMTEWLSTRALGVSKDTDLELQFQGKRALYFCFIYLAIMSCNSQPCSLKPILPLISLISGNGVTHRPCNGSDKIVLPSFSLTSSLAADLLTLVIPNVGTSSLRPLPGTAISG